MISLNGIYLRGELENKRAILRLLSPKPGCSLLDCGCADGEFTLQAVQCLQAKQAYGVEFLPEYIAACQAKGIIVSSKSLNEGIEFPSDSFNVVISNQVIEHLVETDVFVKEIHRVLKPGGLIIISTNNMASWHNIISLVLGMQPMPCHASNEVRLGNILDPTKGIKHLNKGAIHWQVFAYAALRDLFRYHGFTSIQIMASGYYPFPPRIAALLSKVDKWHGVYLILRANKPF